MLLNEIDVCVQPDLQEVVGDQSLSLEGLVAEQRMRQHEESHLDELRQLLLHHDINHPTEKRKKTILKWLFVGKVLSF